MFLKGENNVTEEKQEGTVMVTVLQNCSTSVNGRTKQLKAGETAELPAQTAEELADAGLVEIVKGGEDAPKQK